MGASLASIVSARVESLIALHHAGDRGAAAQRLGIAPDHLDGLLRGEWDLISLDDFAALVGAYSVSPGWLLSRGAAPPAPRRDECPARRARAHS